MVRRQPPRVPFARLLCWSYTDGLAILALGAPKKIRHLRRRVASAAPYAELKDIPTTFTAESRVANIKNRLVTEIRNKNRAFGDS